MGLLHPSGERHFQLEIDGGTKIQVYKSEEEAKTAAQEWCNGRHKISVTGIGKGKPSVIFYEHRTGWVRQQ